eukprot:scaffold4485_cov135-Isochrysis_galbana.AAC.11
MARQWDAIHSGTQPPNSRLSASAHTPHREATIRRSLGIGKHDTPVITAKGLSVPLVSAARPGLRRAETCVCTCAESRNFGSATSMVMVAPSSSIEKGHFAVAARPSPDPGTCGRPARPASPFVWSPLAAHAALVTHAHPPPERPDSTRPSRSGPAPLHVPASPPAPAPWPPADAAGLPCALAPAARVPPAPSPNPEAAVALAGALTC